MGKRSDGHPGSKVRERHISFIQANWEQLAAEAYKGYKDNGRGMLVVDDSDFVKKPRGRMTKFKMTYVAEGSAELKGIGGWPGKKEAGWVKDYEPETTLLIGFARTDTGFSSYRIVGVGDGIPLMAWQRSRGAQN